MSAGIIPQVVVVGAQDGQSTSFLNNIRRVAKSDYVPTTGRFRYFLITVLIFLSNSHSDDILRARLQTMGIASHSFELNLYGKAVSWHLYDVGGSRGQRHTWIPYFDDANAIIFIAPMSAFDQVNHFDFGVLLMADPSHMLCLCFTLQYLEEDGRVNRINDSLQLFTIICSNKLLKNVHLVLFLSKCAATFFDVLSHHRTDKTDILKRKIAAGIEVKK